MVHKTLRASRHVDAEYGFRLRHVRSETEYFRPHDHDYYELFLVIGGEATHIANGKQYEVSHGELIFIRDFDIHDYRAFRDGFEFLNLAFTKETLLAVESFLGCRESFSELLTVCEPPTVHLSERETERIHLKLAALLSEAGDSPIGKGALARRLLADIFVDYFLAREEISASPFWLKNAYLEMRKPRNFLIGTKAFFELTGKSREHSTRLLAEHYGTSPSDYVSDLRLGYAAGLLKNSNLSVSEICYKSGFNNISYFYQRFRKKFEQTPLEYRKKG